MTDNWRTVEEWRSMNVPISTPSNDACKMFDAALTQYVTWKEMDSVGGVEGALDTMMAADPDFVMGHVIKNGLEAMGTGRSTKLDAEFKADINTMVHLAHTQSGLSASEIKHAEAVKLFSEGQMKSAAQTWESILVDHPLDMLALKFAHDSYFYLGEVSQTRDSIARILPHYSASNRYYGYLHGMYAFGLEETNMYEQAEKMARKGLEINPSDAWSTHAVCHVMEMTGRQDDGINFLDKTINDWEPCDMLACHNFWHWSLFHVEKGDYQAAIDILDNQISTRAKTSHAMLDVVDVASLLFRLEMEGVNMGGRWEDVYETVRPHLDDHLLVFNDAHLLMVCLGAGNDKAVQHMMDSVENFVKTTKSELCDVMKEVGHALCKALVEYKNDDFANAVELLLPVRYRIITIGGSHAQRDVFNLFLIHSALKSSKADHHRLARSLLLERKALKDGAPMTDRLMARAMALHDN